MENFTRRKFITYSGLTTLSLFVPSFLISGAKKNHFDQKALNELIYKAAKARKNQNFNRAEKLFKKALRRNPKEARIYLGLRRTYLMQKGKKRAALNVLEEAVQLNPNDFKLLFKLAKTYQNIATGDQKFCKRLGTTGEGLLTKSNELFTRALSLKPKNKAVKQAIEKNHFLLENSVVFTDARDNKALKARKKQNRKSHKKQFDQLSVGELKNKLERLKERPNPSSRKKQIKALYRTLIGKYKKKEQYDKALMFAVSLYAFDHNDSCSLSEIRKFSRKTRLYGQRVEIERINHKNKQTFWSNIGLYDAQFLQYRFTGKGSFVALEQRLNACTSYPFYQPDRKEVEFRRIQLHLFQKQYDSAYDLLLAFGKNITGISSVHQILRYNRLLTMYYRKTGQKVKAVKALNQLQAKDKEKAFSVLVKDELLKTALVINTQAEVVKEHHIGLIQNMKNDLIKNTF